MDINWNSSVLWGIFGLIGGGIISFVFFMLSNKTKRLVYQKYSNPLISDKLSKIKGLNITFFNAPISNLVSTTIIIENNGSDIIEYNDLAKVSPLILKTNGEFLVYDDVNSFITTVSNKTNNVSLFKVDDSTIKVNFDYFRKNDKISFTLLHTDQVELLGTLKKGKIIESSTFAKKNQISKFLSIILVAFLLTLLILIRGLDGSINSLLNIIINILIGYSLINYAQKKYQEIDMQKGIYINGSNLESFSIISGNDNIINSKSSKH